MTLGFLRRGLAVAGIIGTFWPFWPFCIFAGNLGLNWGNGIQVLGSRGLAFRGFCTNSIIIYPPASTRSISKCLGGIHGPYAGSRPHGRAERAPYPPAAWSAALAADRYIYPHLAAWPPLPLCAHDAARRTGRICAPTTCQ